MLRRTALSLVLVACGSRTGLFADDEGFTDVTPGADAGADGSRDDAARLGDGEVVGDAPPPIDVRPPTDVDRRDCPDADATLIYTITNSYELQSFNPATGEFRGIGSIQCPAPPSANPFSMAVDRKGIAYVLFTDNRIYRVSTATTACIATSFTPNQSGFRRFGMGFATNSVGPTETLFVAGDDNQNDNGASGLARIDPGTFTLDAVGEFFPTIDSAELTGTGDGRLFAFYKKASDGVRPTVSYIGQIDTGTAHVIGERRFDAVDQGSAWAFAYWGGDFYMFHAPGPENTTRVTRWRPSDDSVTHVATTSLTIVGAGVSTCAPQQ